MDEAHLSEKSVNREEAKSLQSIVTLAIEDNEESELVTHTSNTRSTGISIESKAIHKQQKRTSKTTKAQKHHQT
jgi:hypothetical protein